MLRDVSPVLYVLYSVAIVFYVAVMFAYEQCLLVLGHHPDIWYEAAQYLEQSSKLLAEKGVRDRTFHSKGLVCTLNASTPAEDGV